MCTTIAGTIGVSGAARGRPGWFPVTRATVAYDHPVSVGLDHAVLLDFTNFDLDLGARVAVEMDIPSARSLLQQLTAAIEAAEASGLVSASEASA